MRYSRGATSSLLLAVTATIFTTRLPTSRANVLVADDANGNEVLIGSQQAHRGPGGDEEEAADAGILSSRRVLLGTSGNNKDSSSTILPAPNSIPLSGRSSTSKRRVLPNAVAAEDLCPSGYVHCANGDEVDGATGIPTGSTCATACVGFNCCTEDRACKEFTGKICKDGGCTGKFACYKANIDVVVKSCYGRSACASAGRYYGTAGTFINSCKAAQACNSFAFRGTALGTINDSCNGYKSCWQVAFIKDSTIGSMTSSCNGSYACYQASKYASDTISTNMYFCCNADNECKTATESTLPATCKVREGGGQGRSNHAVLLMPLLFVVFFIPCRPQLTMLLLLSFSPFNENNAVLSS